MTLRARASKTGGWGRYQRHLSSQKKKLPYFASLSGRSLFHGYDERVPRFGTLQVSPKWDFLFNYCGSARTQPPKKNSGAGDVG